MVRTHGRSLVMLALIALLMFSGQAFAQTDSWAPPRPGQDSKDWLKLTSGEWLRGTIDLFRDKALEFDSDELDDQVIDWDDISEFRSPHVLTYVFTHDRVATGTATMDAEGMVRVRVGSNIQEFRRKDLLSIIAGEARELDYWSALASIGLTIRSGNTDQQDLNTLIKIKREATRSRFDIGLSNNYGKVSDIETIDNRRATGDMAWFISRRIFVTPLSAEYYADRFQNIDYRASIGANGGYYFFRRGDLEWRAVLGGSYRKTTSVSVEVGQDISTETGSVNPATYFEMDITSDIEIAFDYAAQVGVPDPKDTTHHAEFFASIDLIGDIFELTLSVIFDRVENPQKDADGNTPQRNDTRLNFGFGIDL